MVCASQATRQCQELQEVFGLDQSAQQGRSVTTKHLRQANQSSRALSNQVRLSSSAGLNSANRTRLWVGPGLEWAPGTEVPFKSFAQCQASHPRYLHTTLAISPPSFLFVSGPLDTRYLLRSVLPFVYA